MLIVAGAEKNILDLLEIFFFRNESSSYGTAYCRMLQTELLTSEIPHFHSFLWLASQSLEGRGRL